MVGPKLKAKPIVDMKKTTRLRVASTVVTGILSSRAQHSLATLKEQAPQIAELALLIADELISKVEKT